MHLQLKYNKTLWKTSIVQKLLSWSLMLMLSAKFQARARKKIQDRFFLYTCHWIINTFGNEAIWIHNLVGSAATYLNWFVCSQKSQKIQFSFDICLLDNGQTCWQKLIARKYEQLKIHQQNYSENSLTPLHGSRKEKSVAPGSYLNFDANCFIKWLPVLGGLFGSCANPNHVSVEKW